MTTWLSPSELRAWRALQRMHMRLDGALARQLAVDSGLSYADYQVLVVLSEVPDGRLRVLELAEELGWEKSRLSHQLARMALRGLVTKERCEADRRGAYAAITADGRNVIEAAAPGHVATVRRLFVEPLDAADLAAVADMAERVLAAFDAEPPAP